MHVIDIIFFELVWAGGFIMRLFDDAINSINFLKVQIDRIKKPSQIFGKAFGIEHEN